MPPCRDEGIRAGRGVYVLASQKAPTFNGSIGPILLRNLWAYAPSRIAVVLNVSNADSAIVNPSNPFFASLWLRVEPSLAKEPLMGFYQWVKSSISGFDSDFAPQSEPCHIANGTSLYLRSQLEDTP